MMTSQVMLMEKLFKRVFFYLN